MPQPSCRSIQTTTKFRNSTMTHSASLRCKKTKHSDIPRSRHKIYLGFTLSLHLHGHFDRHKSFRSSQRSYSRYRLKKGCSLKYATFAKLRIFLCHKVKMTCGHEFNFALGSCPRAIIVAYNRLRLVYIIIMTLSINADTTLEQNIVLIECHLTLGCYNSFSIIANIIKQGLRLMT